ncbi:hypothetical protein D3C73_1609090 [compost metagenome]
MECTPIRKMQASSSGTFCASMPQATRVMMASSRFFVSRKIRRLSHLSASCPAVAENSRKGRMNSAPMTRPACDGGSQDTLSW